MSESTLLISAKQKRVNAIIIDTRFGVNEHFKKTVIDEWMHLPVLSFSCVQLFGFPPP